MKLFWHYVKKNRWLSLAVLVFAVAGWGMLSGTNVFIQRLVDFIVAGNSDGFLATMAGAAIFVAAAGLVYFTAVVLVEKFLAHMSRDIRADVFDAVMRRTRVDFAGNDTAEYMSAVTNDIRTLMSIFHLNIYIVNFVAAGGSALVIMLFYSVPLTLVAVGCSVLTVVLPVFFSKPMQQRQKNMMDSQAAFTVDMKEILSGHEVVTSLNLLEIFSRRFRKQNDGMMTAGYRLDFLRQGVSATGHMLTYASRFIMILVAGLLVINGTVTLGAFTLFVALQVVLSGNVANVFQMIPMLSSMKPVAEKINGFLKYESLDFTGKMDASLNEKISVEKINFGYAENKLILSDFSETIRVGEKIAITGASGAGKTTLIKLLGGEYASYTGNILYDGINIKDINLAALRRLMVVVHQHTYIFNASLQYNICLGEEFPQAEIDRALQQSGVAKFLPDLENGLDTPCGENGGNLSGGQKQRIAIARALLRGAKFLVLDEGVSAVDVETANEIEQELLDMPSLTLLTVTHRIKDGLLEKYDRIIEM